MTSFRSAHDIAENTMQQLDPLGTLTARPITVIACFAAPALSIALTAQRANEIVYPLVSAAAILVLVAACLILLLASNPVNAPLSGFINGVILALGVLAAILETIGHWQQNAYLSDDWGPTALGILLLASCPYGSAGKLIFAGVCATGFVAVLALMQCAHCVTPNPPIVFAIIAVSPVLALSAAGIGAAKAAVESREKWQANAAEMAREHATALAEPIARTVQEQRVTVLQRDVLPFFGAILERGGLAEEDSARAREISTEVRDIMVAEANRSWLRSVVDETAAKAKIAGTLAVSDERNQSDQMSLDQRVALRAFLVALMAERRFEPVAFEVGITQFERRNYLVLRTGIRRLCRVFSTRPSLVSSIERIDAASRSSIGAELSPYIAVLRSTFPDLRVGNTSANLTLRFSYGQK